MKFKAFPKIPSIKNLARVLRDINPDKQEWQFIGTVKLHGCNAAIGYSEGEVFYQSRNRIITPEDDNYGFAAWAEENLKPKLLDSIGRSTITGTLIIYGEFIGQGIQKGVAVSELPKSFVAFAVSIDGEEVGSVEAMVMAQHFGIDNVWEYPYHTIAVDPENIKLITNEVLEKTLEVEEQCPYAFAHGVEGIGEGIVWSSYDANGIARFKSKGGKHKKGKKPNMQPVDMEMVKKLQDFIDETVTHERLLQGLDYLREFNKPLDETSTGDFLRWIFNDIFEEEASVIEASGFDRKTLGKPISSAARRWYFGSINEI